MNVYHIKGRPKFTLSQNLGYFLWKQTDGFHLRFFTKEGKSYNFQGKLAYQTKLKITKLARIETGIKIYEVGQKLIQWNAPKEDKFNGFDYVTPSNFMIELKINKKKVKPKSIFLGSQMINPESNPFLITQIEENFEFDEKELKRRIKEKVKEPLVEIIPEPLYKNILIPKPEVELELTSVYESTPESEPELTSVYESTPESEPELKPKPLYEPIRETEPEVEQEPIYESTPEKKTKAESETEQELSYKSLPESKPEILSQPTPESMPKKESGFKEDKESEENQNEIE